MKATTNTEVTLRLALYENEVARLPVASRGVTVSEGLAWMTVQGQDRILRAGDCTTFEPGKFAPVVMALRGAPLILEVLGGRSRSAAITPVNRWPTAAPCEELSF